MALSGSFSGSIVNGNYKLRVDWSATQNVSNNTSKITAVMYLVQASSWSLSISSRADNETTINGTEYTWSSPAISNGGGKTTKLATVTSGNITHNADGTKSVTISATFNIRATLSGTYRGTITASQTITLNTIPRATQPTLSSTSVNMGSAVTISMPRASSAFTHDLAYSFNGGSYVSIATGRGTSHSWTVPDLADRIPNATSGAIKIRCITKNGSTTVGTKTVNMTAKVPTSVMPTVDGVAISEGTSGLAAQFGAYVQGKSKLAVTVAASGAKGSSITAYSTTLAGKTYTGRTFTSPVLTTKGSISLVTKVKDSRGRWSAAKTTTITLQAYSTPLIQELRAFRVDSSGAADEQGEYLRLDYRYSVTSLNSKNTARAVVEYKKTTEDTWTELLTNTALSADTSVKPATPTFSIDNQYDLRLTVTDWFGGSRSYMTTLPSGAVILDLLANGKGIALGKVAEAEGFDLGFALAGLSTQTQAGQVELGGLLIQWGGVNITPSAADTPTTAVVTFPRAYSATPTVFVTPVSSVPERISVAIQRSESVVGDPNAKVAVTLTRSGAITATGINWLAIGPS
jgi:hypothetical protein